MKFPESATAHRYLDGLKGIEIGGSAHNSFGLDTINVDKSGSMDTIFKKEEHNLCGTMLPVDVVSEGDNLPFDDNSFDFVLSSHVLEHFYDPIKAILEWQRVARKYVFIIVPHKCRTFDKDRTDTPVSELIDRHYSPIAEYQDADTNDDGDHWSVWTPTTFLNLMDYFNFNVIHYEHTDDKVGNGFTVIINVDEN